MLVLSNSFRGSACARPTEGAAGKATLSLAAIFTTYCDADASHEDVAAATERLMDAHPWENPVIEFDGQAMELLTRA